MIILPRSSPFFSAFLAAIIPFGAASSVFAGLTWDGGGANTNINTQNNWNDNINPTLTGGTSTLTFGTGGSTATINTAVNVTGLVLNRDANFTIANGAGSLTVGSGGITMTLPSTTGRTHTVSESNLNLGASQTWTVTNNTGAARLEVSSVIDDGASTFALTKRGDGTLVLSGNNTFGSAASNGLVLGTNLSATPYTNTGGIIRLAHNNAAGVGRIAVFGGYQTGRLELAGDINVANRIELYGRQGPTHAAINNFSGTNTLSGDWNITPNGSSINIGAEAGSKLIVSGNAATGATERVLTLRGAGEIDFGKVVNSAVFSQVRTVGTGLYTLTQANTYTGTTTVSAGTLALSGAGTLGNGAALTVSGGKLNLGATTQTVGAVSVTAAAASGDTIQNGSLTGTSYEASNTTGNAIISANLLANGEAGFSKSGAGTVTLTGTNTYTGATTVAGGSLIVNGSTSAASAVGVNSGGTLSGSGTVGGNTTIGSGGTLAPGNSPGALAVTGNLTWLEGGNYNWQIANALGSSGSTWDIVNITGALDLTALSANDPFNLNLWSLSQVNPDSNGDVAGFDPTQSYSWTIARATGGISGFDADNFQINLGAINGTGGFSNSLSNTHGEGSFKLAVDGEDLNLVFVSAVPEPTGVLTLAGLLAGGLMTRNRSRKSKTVE